MLQARREAASVRHTQTENISDGSGGFSVVHDGSEGRIADELRRGAGDIVELIAGGERSAGAVQRGGADGRERAAEEGELSAVQGIVADEEPLQQHPLSHVQVREKPVGRRFSG